MSVHPPGRSSAPADTAGAFADRGPTRGCADASAAVGVVGLGLIGGSLVHDLTCAGRRVIGWDPDPGALQCAEEETGLVPAADLAGVLQAGAGAVILAAPVHTLPGLIEVVGRERYRGVVMDVASTKRSVLRAAEAAGVAGRFVGAHPLAGDHRQGWSAARTGLFAEARVFLCRLPGTDEAAVQVAEALWRSVGARPEHMDADAHDSLMAAVSHLPQAVASALGATLAGLDSRVGDLGPGGRDATRLAGSAPDLWTGILLDNADQVLPALARLQDELAGLAGALARRDAHAVRRQLERGREWRTRQP